MGPSIALGGVLDDHLIDNAISNAETLRGTVIRLQAEGAEFIAIHQPRQHSEPRGGIVLLHDQAGNADGLEVIRPLRLGLADAGWDTLSLQLPAGYRDVDSRDWRARQGAITARLKAGLDWLKSRDIQTQAVIAQGDSGIIALLFGAAAPPPELQAIVVISTSLGNTLPEADIESLKSSALPLLDVYAERDIEPVLRSAPARRQLFDDSKSPNRRQIVITGATPGFFDTQSELLVRIRAWLATSTTPQPAKR